MKKLTDQQYRQFIQAYRDGDIEAVDKLVTNSTWIIKSVASHYKGENLIEAGKEGLKKAVEKFDLNKDYKFLAYATWWIRATIHRKLGLPVE